MRTPLLHRPLPRLHEQLQLAVAADHRDVRQRALGRSCSERLEGEPGIERRVLALDNERLDLFVTNGPPRRAPRLLAHQDAVAGRRSLQPGCNVHYVADHGLLSLLVRTDGREHPLTGVYPDA